MLFIFLIYNMNFKTSNKINIKYAQKLLIKINSFN